MQVVLVMFRAEGDKRSFSVTRDVTVIGRREDCDLRIPVSEVSRKHCRIIRDGQTVRAEDLGSSNGTFHNGQRISGSVALEAGDSVQVGPVVFVLQIDGHPPEEELAPFEERAAHQLDDELAAHPPAGLPHDVEEEAENLEILEETPEAELEPIAMSEEHSGGDLEMTEEPIGGPTIALADEHEIQPEADSNGELELLPMAEDESTIPMADDSGPLSLDLLEEPGEHAHSTEHGHDGGEHHEPLSEDDLLMDLNTVEDAHKKH